MITHSEYTQTDPVLATPVPQSVKTFADAGTQVELVVLTLALLVTVAM